MQRRRNPVFSAVAGLGILLWSDAAARVMEASNAFSTIRISDATQSLTAPTHRVSFVETMKDPAYAREVEGRSAEGAALIDCRRGAFQLDHLTVFNRPDLSGAPVLSVPSRSDWRSASQEVTLGRVVQRVCGSARAADKTISPRPSNPRPMRVGAAGLRPRVDAAANPPRRP